MLTPVAQQVLATYRAIEHGAQHAVSRRLPQLLALIQADAGERAEPDRTGYVAPSNTERPRAVAAKAVKKR